MSKKESITFSSLKRERKWPDKLMQQFRILSEVFSNALLRRRADEKIGEALTEIKQLKDRLERENVYLREEIEVNYKHEEIIGKSDYDLRWPEQSERYRADDRDVIESGKPEQHRAVERCCPLCGQGRLCILAWLSAAELLFEPHTRAPPAPSRS